MTSETKLQNKLKRVANFLGYNYIKFSPGPFSPRGIPDAYIYNDSIGIWIETKIHPNKVTALQEKYIKGLPCAMVITEIRDCYRITLVSTPIRNRFISPQDQTKPYKEDLMCIEYKNLENLILDFVSTIRK